MGEYGYDYDNGKIVYHYEDGLVTDDDGKQFMEVGDDHIVDLETNAVHYAPAPSKYNSSSDYADSFSLWTLVGIGSLFLCVVYIYAFIESEAKYFLHALATGLLAFYCFYQAKH